MGGWDCKSTGEIERMKGACILTLNSKQLVKKRGWRGWKGDTYMRERVAGLVYLPV